MFFILLAEFLIVATGSAVVEKLKEKRSQTQSTPADLPDSMNQSKVVTRPIVKDDRPRKAAKNPAPPAVMMTSKELKELQVTFGKFQRTLHKRIAAEDGSGVVQEIGQFKEHYESIKHRIPPELSRDMSKAIDGFQILFKIIPTKFGIRNV